MAHSSVIVFAMLLLASSKCALAMRVSTRTSMQKQGSMPNGTHVVSAPPLCDRAIVAEVCADLSPEDGTVSRQSIQDRLSSNAESVARIWEALKLPENPSCSDVCHAVTAYVDKVGVLPEASDMGCFNFRGNVSCDRSVGNISAMGPKPNADLPSTLIEKESSSQAAQSDASEEDTDEEDSDSKERMKLLFEETGSLIQQSTEEDLDYDTWQGVKRVAMIFRIFPEAQPNAESSLVELGLARRWPAGGEFRTMQAAADAKAYLAHTISSFEDRRTKIQMTKWFGKSAFPSKSTRKDILKALNSVLQMIDNVYFVPMGRGECSPTTYAYVYPSAYKRCSTSEVSSKPCTKTAGGQFVFYLCPYYFKVPGEMVETLVHEGSHHASAYLDDVTFNGATAYGRRACTSLARSKPRSAVKNADNFCYYVQDVADQVTSTTGSDEKVDLPVVEDNAQPDTSGDTSGDTSDEAGNDAEDNFEATCMRSGPLGQPKKIKPDKNGNCECRFGSLTCWSFNEHNKEVKKCPINGRSAHHSHKYAASCRTCKCSYNY